MRYSLAIVLTAGLAIGMAQGRSCGAERKQGVPRGWPLYDKDANAKSSAGIKKLQADKKPGLVYIYPSAIKTNDSAANREASGFKAFVGKIPSDKLLLKKMKEDFVVFGVDKRYATSDMKCQDFGIAILDTTGRKVWLWETAPPSLAVFKGYLFNVKTLIEKAQVVHAAEKIRLDAERKKKEAAEAKKRKEDEAARKLPGFGLDNKKDPKKKKDPPRRPKKEVEDEEE